MNFKKVFATALAASMLVACGDGGASNNSTSKTLNDGDTVKIGFVGPLTGEVSSYGIPVANTIELAIEDYNNSPDAKYKIELLKEDTTGEQTQATNAYKKLVSEGIAGIVGPVITPEGLALGEASKKDLIPIVSSSTSGDSITLNSDGTTKANYFRTCANDSMGGKTVASAIADGTIKNIKKVAVLTNSDSDYSQGCVASFKAQADLDNIQIVLEESYPGTQKDFSTYIEKVKNSGADALFVPDYYELIATMVKQFEDAGFTGTYLGTDGWDGVLSVNGVNAAIFDGAYYTNYFDDRVDEVVSYVNRYKQTYNGETNMFGTMAYDATWVLIKAIEKAGSTDPQAIIDALEETNYDGITGTIQFDEQHNPVKDVIVKTIKDGKYSYLD